MNHANPNRLSDPETLIQCPYDNTHMIRVKRWQPHIIKCRRNHPTTDLKCCPFNARHELPSVEMPYHLTTCPDQVVVHGEILQSMGENTGPRGDLSVPPLSHWGPSITSDDWSQEYRLGPVKVNVGGAQQSVAGIDRSIFTPGQRREYRKLLKQLADAEKAGEPTDEIRAAIKTMGRSRTSEGSVAERNLSDPTDEMPSPGLRMPHGPPQVDMINKRMNGVQKNSTHNDTAPKSRLAANFNNSNRNFSAGRGFAPVAPSSQGAEVDKRVEMLAKLAAGRGAGKPRVQ